MNPLKKQGIEDSRSSPTLSNLCSFGNMKRKAKGRRPFSTLISASSASDPLLSVKQNGKREREEALVEKASERWKEEVMREALSGWRALLKSSYQSLIIREVKQAEELVDKELAAVFFKIFDSSLSTSERFSFSEGDRSSVAEIIASFHRQLPILERFLNAEELAEFKKKYFFSEKGVNKLDILIDKTFSRQLEHRMTASALSLKGRKWSLPPFECLTPVRGGKDPRLLYPSDVWRSLIPDGGIIIPQKIVIGKKNILKGSDFHFDSEKKQYTLKAEDPKTALLQLIIKELLELFREVSLESSTVAELVERYKLMETLPPPPLSIDTIESIFDWRQKKSCRPGDPQERELERQREYREIYYKIEATRLFREYPEFALLGMMTINAYEPIRTLQGEHLPSTTLNPHSDVEGFCTYTDKDFGTELYIEKEAVAGENCSFRATVHHKKRAKLYPVKERDLPALHFRTTWSLSMCNSIDTPLRAEALFTKLSIAKGVPPEKGERIAEAFIEYKQAIDLCR